MNWNKKAQKKINAGSMADIAFLLLIFFLVTTTIVQEKGITVKLPPYEDDIIQVAVSEDRVLTVKLNAANELLFEGEPIDVSLLKANTKKFIKNPSSINGKSKINGQPIISFQNDRGTTYSDYLAVYNELKAAYNEVWNEESREKFGINFTSLSPSNQKKIRKKYPLIISEAEPTNYISDNTSE